MRQLTFAASLLFIASLTAPAAATSQMETCDKPGIRGSIPEDGMTDVPIDTVVRAWIGYTPDDCSNADRSYQLGLSDESGATLDGMTYFEIAPESGVLPANSQVTLAMKEDGVTVWSATFTTGSALAAPPVAPSEAKLVSFTFEPASDDGSDYHGYAKVRIRPATPDPLTSAVLTSAGGVKASNRVQAPGEDGFYDVTLAVLVGAGEKHCVRPGLQNAAGKIAYGEPLCADAPPPQSGCSIGTGARGKGGSALVGLLVGVAGAVVRRVRRRRAS